MRDFLDADELPQDRVDELARWLHDRNVGICEMDDDIVYNDLKSVRQLAESLLQHGPEGIRIAPPPPDRPGDHEVNLSRLIEDAFTSGGGLDSVVEVVSVLLEGRDAEIERLRDKAANAVADQATLKGLSVEEGALVLDLGSPRELVIAWVDAARKMLGDAENYSETRVDFPAVSMEVKAASELERYVFTVQRAGKLTPHEARTLAEARVAELTRERDAAADEISRLRFFLAGSLSLSANQALSMSTMDMLTALAHERDRAREALDYGRPVAQEAGERPVARVWRTGDPEPVGVPYESPMPRVVDRYGVTWVADERGDGYEGWRPVSHGFDGWWQSWRMLTLDRSPLTEVIEGGDSGLADRRAQDATTLAGLLSLNPHGARERVSPVEAGDWLHGRREGGASDAG